MGEGRGRNIPRTPLVAEASRRSPDARRTRKVPFRALGQRPVWIRSTSCFTVGTKPFE